MKSSQKLQQIKISESQIQKAVIAFLSYRKDLYFFRAGSGTLQTERGSFFRTGKPGCPDIVICFEGRFIGFEIKTQTGKQTLPQKETEKLINVLGGKYFVIRSVDEAINALESLGG